MSEINKINYNGTEYDIGGSSGTGLTDDAKIALLACFENVVWVGDDGQDYYNALHDALYPPANLVSITAVFSQGANVIYDNQPLSDLKQYLVVTAHYDDSSTATVNTYSLGGELETGTSTITVGYGGKTTTFTVTVTHATVQYSITNNLSMVTTNNSAYSINENLSYSATLTVFVGYIMASVSVAMGGIDITSTAYDDSNGSISISSVTGDLVINAVAVEDVGWISGIAYSSNAINMGNNGYRVDGSTGALYESGNQSDMVSDFIPCYGASAITVPSGLLVTQIYYYDSNKSYIMYVSVQNAIENPFPTPVPRNAHYFRIVSRSLTPSVIPYLYDKLPANTQYVLDKHYVFDWGNSPEATTGSVNSPKVFCFGATKLQTSMWTRSFIYFYDSENNLLSYATRAANATEIEIPVGAHTLMFEIAGANTNNPWFVFTE